MSSLKKQLTLMLSIGLLVNLLGCSEQPEAEKAVKEPWALQTTQVQVESLPIIYRTTGSIVSDHRVDVASRSTGYIKKILVREGDSVTTGQALVVLDGADVEGAIRQVTASVDKAKSALKDAQTDLDSFQALFKRGSVSENKLRKVRLQRDIAQDTLREAKAALETTQSQRQYTQITSPVSGVVVGRHKREGDLAAPAMPLLTVESGEGLLFETYIGEGQLKNISRGETVELVIDALEEPLQGVIARVVPSADPLTRKSQVKVSLPDNSKLRPGMFGRAHFKVGVKSSPVIRVESLISRAGLTGVYIVDQQQRIHFRWLRLGKTTRGKIEVLVGLTGGEQIVSAPTERLREGDSIQARDVVGE
ncbi:efflux RND transporter periplasmic adaptor subunit [uncultured Cycloclasticus sp.]|uniref:efflux RND transporter periplasmic adaptor subunit n=1 Tax=uncultured Cycloclasticus sp. TaxID=172194 RepID=UPI00258E6558|nr:efflux RND transporter periplasmic adaptor subunit [uncultured Cycloclasticus sp.]